MIPADQDFQIRGRLMHDEPMARHCSWRTGGVADLFFEPADKEDLASFIAQVKADVEITWVGLGSNLLVRDGGVRGVVIGPLNKLNSLKLLDENRVYVECGVTCSRFSRFCVKNNLAGADFLAGIPGTIGGALAMNAGAWGGETWQHVDTLEMMNRNGEIILRDKDEFEVSYRSVKRNVDEWFSAAIFKFPQLQDQAQSNIKKLLEERNAKQPIGLPSCGSVFKNPEGDHAARLIEACGLKGHCLGGACVSDKHANFIINSEQATAAEIEDLIALVRQRVQEQFGIQLHTEVRIIGDRL